MSIKTNHHRASTPTDSPPLIESRWLIPFILVVALFPLWGFANHVTDPLVKAFKDIFLISNMQSSLVQFAFYLGYGVMAIPAAIFIRSYSYKSGILLGLALYALGAALFVPASLYQEFYFFLAALCVLTCGLALLEVTANPYVLSMGHPDTATRRLNFAQSFNPVGSLTGMFVASSFILSQLEVEKFRSMERAANPEYEDMLPSIVDGKMVQALNDFALQEPAAHQAMQAADLLTVRGPYIAIALVVAILFCIFLFSKLPQAIKHNHPLTGRELKETFARLMRNRRYIEGVGAQTFYVGAQIMCWTFIIHYGITAIGLTAVEAQHYNIIAVIIFLLSRFFCTFLLKFVHSGQLLMALAIGATTTTSGAVFLDGYMGLYCLIGTAACMSLMFPTIYGIALKGMGDDASLASAGLVMAIVGGALMPPLQGAMIDAGPIIGSIPSVKTSFFLPMVCFVVVAMYGYRSHYIHKA